MEARTGIEPVIELLQSPALPLGYLAVESGDVRQPPDASQRWRALNQCEKHYGRAIILPNSGIKRVANLKN